ncbi:succinate dehydrogenase [Pseudomonas sp. MPC6]|uniref:succinate dehydrogenase n=1 Tax=unclassified Pseudomonas TaxID=196821 RepID=UPI001110A4FB|nr:succinate dehydrogenase [Pseudomonas sp. MPC6]QCY09556.1 succinate dehydrogenase [Pseudomonas sp. MPC6]
MSTRIEFKLWLLHRVSAMLLGLFVVIHIVGMIIAIQGGLSSAEILQRTSENYVMGVFYSVFTIAAAVHSSIGLRTVAFEVLGWRGAIVNRVLTVFFLMLCVTGISAIGGLVL